MRPWLLAAIQVPPPNGSLGITVLTPSRHSTTGGPASGRCNDSSLLKNRSSPAGEYCQLSVHMGSGAFGHTPGLPLQVPQGRGVDSEPGTDFHARLLGQHADNRHVMDGMAGQEHQFPIHAGLDYLPLFVTGVQHGKPVEMVRAESATQRLQNLG